MLLKSLGCVLIITSATAVGFGYVNILKKRIAGLNRMIELLTIIKIKLEYEFCSIPDILRQIKDNDTLNIKDFLENCISEIDNGISLKSAWCSNIDRYSQEMFLIKSDKNLLIEFTNALGDTDASGQVTNLEVYIEMLGKNLTTAENELKEKSHVALCCSMFIGILISILMI